MPKPSQVIKEQIRSIEAKAPSRRTEVDIINVDAKPVYVGITPAEVAQLQTFGYVVSGNEYANKAKLRKTNRYEHYCDELGF